MLAACRSNWFVVTVTERVGWQIGSTHTWLPTSHKGAALHVRYQLEIYTEVMSEGKNSKTSRTKAPLFSGIWHRGQWHRSLFANLREVKFMPVYWGARIFRKSTSKILGDRNVTWSKFDIEDPQILGAAPQNLVGRAKWSRDIWTHAYVPNFTEHGRSWEANSRSGS